MWEERTAAPLGWRALPESVQEAASLLESTGIKIQMNQGIPMLRFLCLIYQGHLLLGPQEDS